MKLQDIYESAYRAGIEADPRGRDGVRAGARAGARRSSTSYLRASGGSSTRKRWSIPTPTRASW